MITTDCETIDFGKCKEDTIIQKVFFNFCVFRFLCYCEITCLPPVPLVLYKQDILKYYEDFFENRTRLI